MKQRAAPVPASASSAAAASAAAAAEEETEEESSVGGVLSASECEAERRLRMRATKIIVLLAGISILDIFTDVVLCFALAVNGARWRTAHSSHA